MTCKTRISFIQTIHVIAIFIQFTQKFKQLKLNYTVNLYIYKFNPALLCENRQCFSFYAVISHCVNYYIWIYKPCEFMNKLKQVDTKLLLEEFINKSNVNFVRYKLLKHLSHPLVRDIIDIDHRLFLHIHIKLHLV